MLPLQEHCVLPPTHATHRLGGAIPRGRGPPALTRQNTAIEYFPCSQVRDSNLLPFGADLRSPLKPDVSGCAGKLDETKSSICKSFPGADTGVCPILEDVRPPRGPRNTTRN